MIESDINLYYSFNKQKGGNYMYSKITEDRMNLEGIVGHADDFYDAYKQAQQKIKEKRADDFDYRIIECMPIVHRLINNHQDLFVSEQRQCIEYIHNTLFDMEINNTIVKKRKCYICPDGHICVFPYVELYVVISELPFSKYNKNKYICPICGQKMDYVGLINDDGYCSFKLEITEAKEIYSKDDINIIEYKYKVIYDTDSRKFDDMLLKI